MRVIINIYIASFITPGSSRLLNIIRTIRFRKRSLFTPLSLRRFTSFSSLSNSTSNSGGSNRDTKTSNSYYNEYK